MRLPRTSLLGRLAGPDGPRSSCWRRRPGTASRGSPDAPRGADVAAAARRARPARATTDRVDQTVLIDDAHLLGADDVDRLVERIEDASTTPRLIIAGRILPDVAPRGRPARRRPDHRRRRPRRHRRRGRSTGSRTGRPTLARRSSRPPTAASASSPPPSTRPPRSGRRSVALASRMVRAASAAALQQPRRHASTPSSALLARAPGIDRHLLDRSPAPGSSTGRSPPASRCAASSPAGSTSPRRSAFRAGPGRSGGRRPRWPPSWSSAAGRSRRSACSSTPATHDAGDARMVMDLSESVTDTVEPRPCSACSPASARSPSASRPCCCCAPRPPGRSASVDEAVADIDRAVTLATSAPASAAPAGRGRGRPRPPRRGPPGRGRARSPSSTLLELGAGEEQHVRPRLRGARRVRGHVRRPGRPAAGRRALPRRRGGVGGLRRVRPGPGLPARPRHVGAVVPLGRYDEALAQLGQLLGTADLSDAERSWTVLVEGFVLYNANRLESADVAVRARRRPRLRARQPAPDRRRRPGAGRWSASRRGDVGDTLRWIGSAENTALGDADDVLGVPFLCDMATVLGAPRRARPGRAVPRPGGRAPPGVP